MQRSVGAVSGSRFGFRQNEGRARQKAKPKASPAAKTVPAAKAATAKPAAAKTAGRQGTIE